MTKPLIQNLNENYGFYLGKFRFDKSDSWQISLVKSFLVIPGIFILTTYFSSSVINIFTIITSFSTNILIGVFLLLLYSAGLFVTFYIFSPEKFFQKIGIYNYVIFGIFTILQVLNILQPIQNINLFGKGIFIIGIMFSIPFFIMMTWTFICILFYKKYRILEKIYTIIAILLFFGTLFIGTTNYVDLNSIFLYLWNSLSESLMTWFGLFSILFYYILEAFLLKKPLEVFTKK